MKTNCNLMVCGAAVVCLLMFPGCSRGEESTQSGTKSTLPEAGAQRQEATEPNIPFALVEDKVVVNLPFGNQVYEGSPKDGFHFLAVVVTTMKGEQRLSDSQMNHAVLDKKGTKYEPIAFGTPHALGKPFLIHGFSFEGDISLAENEETVLVLFYLVPKEPRDFEMRTPKGKTVDLPLVDKWVPPKSMNIFGFRSYGEVAFGTPTIEKNGWGLK
jgi:hypothetical protein